MPLLTPQERNAIEVEVVDTLCTVYDPEIPVNIYELGLIYDIAVGKEGDVKVEMTLTSPGCPVAGTLPGEVEAKVRRVELVWEPAWSMDRMSDEAKLELGML
jgi:FeS assembly SUF system protein